jgi:3-dehydroquinate synthase
VTVSVPIDALPLDYPVIVERGAVKHLAAQAMAVAPAHRYAVIVDATVAGLRGARLRAGFPEGRTLLLTVPPGEHEKTRQRWATLTDALLEWGATRDTTIIAVGGGVVCDLAGFVAATFMRGVPVVQVPTTLLAMVDAAVGGKTAVDTPAGKNLVGAFHDPVAVIADPDVLTSLPAPVFRSGLAEMIKHGVLGSAQYFDDMSASLRELSGAQGAAAPALPSLISGSIAIKAAIVADDARERGRRQVLNFGHTIAHAVEQCLDFQLLHGDAVAIGMVVEAHIAEVLGLAPSGLAATIADAVRRAGLPDRVPKGIDIEALIRATHGDKKARAGDARYALPVGIGSMSPGDGSWSVSVPDGVASAAVADLC